MDTKMNFTPESVWNDSGVLDDFQSVCPLPSKSGKRIMRANWLNFLTQVNNINISTLESIKKACPLDAQYGLDALLDKVNSYQDTAQKNILNSDLVTTQIPNLQKLIAEAQKKLKDK